MLMQNYVQTSVPYIISFEKWEDIPESPVGWPDMKASNLSIDLIVYLEHIVFRTQISDF
jgi:hypothetical protein